MKTKTIIYSALILLFLSLVAQLRGQTAAELIPEIKQLMLDQYIFLDQAKATNAHLDKLLSEGHFDQFETKETLASGLTEALRSITKDLHLSVGAPRTIRTTSNSAPNYMRGLSRYYRPIVHDFSYYEDNVAYFNMQFFGGGDRHFDRIDAIMEQMETADAIIIDLRYSLGGTPRMVEYLASYFMEGDGELIHSIYYRFNDDMREYRIKDVNGVKRPDVPLFFLTSKRTFSAAEGLPYTLQAAKRATIVGEVTRGGAHPVRSHNLKGNFRVRIPFGRSIDPNTNSNWEGTGIQPDYEVAADEALDKAKELASVAAKAYRDNFFEPLLKDLLALETGKQLKGEQLKIQEKIRSAVKRGVLHESDINRLGSNFLLDKKYLAAQTLLKVNMKLYPESPFVYDRYAGALVESGTPEKALEYYQKALSLAQSQNHVDLELFERHLREYKTAH